MRTAGARPIGHPSAPAKIVGAPKVERPHLRAALQFLVAAQSALQGGGSAAGLESLRQANAQLNASAPSDVYQRHRSFAIDSVHKALKALQSGAAGGSEALNQTQEAIGHVQFCLQCPPG